MFSIGVASCGALAHVVGACDVSARAFAIAGPTVWNSLPDGLRHKLRDPAVGPDQFRRDLKTHLFE